MTTAYLHTDDERFIKLKGREDAIDALLRSVDTLDEIESTEYVNVQVIQ